MVQRIWVRAAFVLVAAVSAIVLAGCAKDQPASVKSAASKQSGPRQAPAKPGPSEQAAPATGNSSFVRPAAGNTIAGYDGVRNKGIDIDGSRGDPVIAAASGRVMLVSNSLRSYGTMIIIKHNAKLITAYAHLDRVLVREDEQVKQGQKIGDMGSTGTDRVKLHFEVRKDGVATNPAPYLQGR
ncbi:lipoprotein NlpD [Variovorax sp. GrIS 2.14]